MKNIVRIILVGLVFNLGFCSIGIYFQLNHWLRWVFFAVGFFTICYPVLEYWNEKLKKINYGR